MAIRGRLAIILVACAAVLPAWAGTIEQNGATIVIGPDARWSPGDACTAPVHPAGNNDIAALSSYQAARAKFMDCVQHEAATDKDRFQQNLDQSLAAIGEDQSPQLAIIQQENRGALNKLRNNGSR